VTVTGYRADSPRIQLHTKGKLIIMTETLKDPGFAATADLLGKVTASMSADPPELPRLTVAQTFITYQRIGTALESACAGYKELPNVSSVDDGRRALTDIIRGCEAVIKHAQRLLEGNR
jgi:hypothetical protein